MIIKLKSISQNWYMVSGILTLVVTVIFYIATVVTTLHDHSAALTELKTTAVATSDKVDAKFDAVNQKLDRIGEGVSYVKGKVDEMDRPRATAFAPDNGGNLLTAKAP